MWEKQGKGEESQGRLSHSTKQIVTVSLPPQARINATPTSPEPLNLPGTKKAGNIPVVGRWGGAAFSCRAIGKRPERMEGWAGQAFILPSTEGLSPAPPPQKEWGERSEEEQALLHPHHRDLERENSTRVCVCVCDQRRRGGVSPSQITSKPCRFFPSDSPLPSPPPTYKIVPAAVVRTEDIEGDARVRVEIHPPLRLLGGDELEGGVGAPFIRNVSQLLEIHPPLPGLPSASSSSACDCIRFRSPLGG